MKRMLRIAALSAAAWLFFCQAPVLAQGAVVNGDFETGSHAPMWTLTGGNQNTQVVVWETKPGDMSYSLERMPGTPSGNGGFQQTVALVGGIKYLFHADIASKFGPC